MMRRRTPAEETVALDALPEDPPDKQERWKAPRSGTRRCSGRSRPRRSKRTHWPLYREDHAFVVAQLESAAIRLRDAELAKKQALVDYQQALNNVQRSSSHR
jgi:hypothetical protein